MSSKDTNVEPSDASVRHGNCRCETHAPKETIAFFPSANEVQEARAKGKKTESEQWREHLTSLLTRWPTVDSDTTVPGRGVKRTDRLTPTKIQASIPTAISNAMIQSIVSDLTKNGYTATVKNAHVNENKNVIADTFAWIDRDFLWSPQPVHQVLVIRLTPLEPKPSDAREEVQSIGSRFVQYVLTCHLLIFCAILVFGWVNRSMLFYIIVALICMKRLKAESTTKSARTCRHHSKQRRLE